MKAIIDNFLYRVYQLWVYLKFLLKWQLRLKKCGFRSYWIAPIRIIYPSLISMGDNVVILNGSRIEIQKLDDLSQGVYIEDGVNIGHNFFCSSASRVEIKKGVLISDNVAIIDNNHSHIKGISSVTTEISTKPIIIQKNSTIYRNVTILSGVTIGEGAVIAAHSLVKEDVEPFTVVGGCPAKKISTIE